MTKVRSLLVLGAMLAAALLIAACGSDSSSSDSGGTIIRGTTDQPISYDPAGAYPLIVQLDPTFAGLREYEHTVGLVSRRAADGRWPEAIVLGVDYPDPWTRHRDYTPTDDPDPARRPRLVIEYQSGGVLVPEPALMTLVVLVFLIAAARRG